jgi:ribonuclease III
VAKILLALKLLFLSGNKNNKELIKLLGYHPRKQEIYNLAFIHSSASLLLPDKTAINNERLEFLGDAILDAVVAEYLFRHYPNKDEGFLSKMRSKIVKRKHLNSLAINIGIDKFIVANAINNSGSKHISGNAFEALIGAIYLDKGYKKAKKFIIHKILNTQIDLDELENTETDFKSRIIEWAQKNRFEISFENQEEYSASDHSPLFVSRIMVANQLMGCGKGTSKKEAEQNAAEQVYNSIPTQ